MASRFSHPISHRIAATALLAAMALPVLAQQPPAAPAAPTAPAKASEGRHERHHGDMAQRHAKRLADLKAQLKLTPAQESAWTTFTTAMQPGERPARLDRQDMDKLTTPERIDRMRAMRSQQQSQHRLENHEHAPCCNSHAISPSAIKACRTAVRSSIRAMKLRRCP